MRSLTDRVLALALLDRLHGCDDPAIVEAARPLAPLLAAELSADQLARLRGQLGATDPAIRGPLMELLLELCPPDGPLGDALGIDDTLLEDYASALPRPPREPAALARFAASLGWPRVIRAVLRSLPADAAVAILARTGPLGWPEPDLAALGDHRAAVVRGARTLVRSKLWLHLIAALTPEARHALGSSALLPCCRSWSALITWLDDALYGLGDHVARGVITADEAQTLSRLHTELHALDLDQPDATQLDALGARYLRDLGGDRGPLAVAHEPPPDRLLR